MLRETAQRWVARAFSGEGWLEVRRGKDRSIADTRDKLGIYTRTGLLGADSEGAIPLLTSPKGDPDAR